MINKKSLNTLFVLSFFMPSLAIAKMDYVSRGYLATRVSQYTENKKEKNAERFRAQFEQVAKYSDNLTFVNQLRWKYSSIYNDLANTPSNDKDDTREIYLGDNYFKFQSDSYVLQTGYQEVAWGEAFGFNYADIVNPKDLRETFYSDYSESRLPLFIANYKYFFKNGSIQFIYSPEPRFSKNLPINLYSSTLFPNANISIKKEKSPDFFKEHEWGGKISTSYEGFDLSAFYFDHIDRETIYDLESLTLTSVVLKERHERINTAGISFAKTFFDDYVLRSDIAYSKNKAINFVSGFNVSHYKTNLTNVLVSLDSPTYNNLSAVIIFANSMLAEINPNSFREKETQYSILKLSYDFKEEKIFDLSYTHEFKHVGHALQSQLSWPINSTLDMKLGAEYYWGAADSNMQKLNNVTNIFFSIKNYFQL